MKNLAIRFAAPLLMAALLILATGAAPAQIRPVKTIRPATFNKIVVSGNVTVLITQRTRENIIADREYDKARISIKKKGYALLISSEESEPITINVSVKDLQRIHADDHAMVRTIGCLEVQHLQVFLKGKASARVKANTESLYTYITGNADLKVSGSTGEHFLIKDELSTLNTENLVAARITRDSVRTEVVAAFLDKK